MNSAKKTETLAPYTKTHGGLVGSMKKYTALYIMAVPVVAYFFIFAYIPMYGVIVAFQEYVPTKGVLGSPFIGFRNFVSFFSSHYFSRLLINTLLLSFYDLLFAFPAPILLALLINEVTSRKFKRVVQTITYLPYFISLVVVAGIIKDFVLPDGLINDVLALFGFERTNLLGYPEYFRTIFVGSNIWQGIGFGSIIYLAAITGVDPELYEAAVMDGAGRLKQTWYITLPSILPTIIVLLILRIGGLMNIGYEKIILLYSAITYQTADVISSFVYRKGLLEADYDYSTAVGLFNSVINFILLVTANKLSKKVTGSSLW